mgnify:CR=1 FL=1
MRKANIPRKHVEHRKPLQTLDLAQLGERLVIARERKGWTQQDLSAVALFSRTGLCRLERGGKPWVSVETLYRLACALDVSTDWLLGLARGDTSRLDDGCPEGIHSARLSPIQA